MVSTQIGGDMDFNSFSNTSLGHTMTLVFSWLSSHVEKEGEVTERRMSPQKSIV